MAISQSDFKILQSLNTTVRMQLFPCTRGVNNNRVIIYGLPSTKNIIALSKGGLILTDIEWMKAYYVATSKGAKLFYKTITVTLD